MKPRLAPDLSSLAKKWTQNLDTALTASGNSSVCGAIVAKSFTCTGTFDFHFDDATGGNAAKSFKILSWAEL